MVAGDDGTVYCIFVVVLRTAMFSVHFCSLSIVGDQHLPVRDRHHQSLLANWFILT